jgi:hypothetical protein
MKAVEAKKDTNAWIMLVWLAFAAAVALSAIGIWNMPVDAWKKGFMAMGMLFTLGSTFSLVKTTRDNRFRRVDTNAWVFQVWTSFAIALVMTAGGLWNLELPSSAGGNWVKGFMAIALFFMMMMAFALAKTVRDNNPTLIDELDIDGDGQVSRGEAMENPKLARSFDAIDANKDGKLSPAEIRAHVAGGAPKQ